MFQVQDDGSTGPGEPDGLFTLKLKHGDHRPAEAALARDHGRYVWDTICMLDAGLDPSVLVNAQHASGLIVELLVLSPEKTDSR